MKLIPTFDQLRKRFPALTDAFAARGRRGRIPYVQQLSATECGAACLAMVLRYYRRDVALEAIRDVTVSGRDATNAHMIIEAARIHGLRGRAVALDIEELKYLERGAILHWRFNHFVVLDRLAERSVDIVDPAGGRRRIALSEFRKQFTGVAILLEPMDTFAPQRRADKLWLEYLKGILTERRFFFHIVAVSVLIQCLGLGTPLISRTLVDAVIPHADRSLFFLLATGAVAILVFQAMTSLVRSYLFLYLNTRLVARMTLAFLEHLVSLPFEFFQRRSMGDLLVRMASNAAVKDILTSTVLSTMLDGWLVLGYLVLLLVMSWPVAVLTLGLAGVQVLLFVVTRRQQREFVAQGLEAQGRSQSYLVETLSAIETLKSLGAEQRAAERWSELFSAELNVSIRRGRLDAVLDALSGAIRGASSLLLLGLAAWQVMAGQLTLGDMLAVVAVANGFLTPLLSLASAGTRLQMLAIYMERLGDVFRTPAEAGPSDRQDPGQLTGSITLQGVSFRYGPASPLVVRHVSIKIGAGEFVAIVGRSGAGKSTLARLLSGLYIPTEGRIAYDGLDLNQVDLQKLRRQIGVVTQQAQLFGGTIRSNIALAEPTMRLDNVITAARAACVDDDIRAMPLGYETSLIDRGASLSGGQQQRLCLARALASRPRILLLDEATSQLDAATEQAVQSQLAGLQCTRVVIAHRLSTIVNADRILVMDDGAVVEEGTHAELLGKNSVYARLVSLQLRQERPEATNDLA